MSRSALESSSACLDFSSFLLTFWAGALTPLDKTALHQAFAFTMIQVFSVVEAKGSALATWGASGMTRCSQLIS